MKAQAGLLLLATVVLVVQAAHHAHHVPTTTTTTTTAKPLTTEELVHKLAGTVNTMATEMSGMKSTLEELTRQVMLQQLYVEERIRSDGDSGLKQTRVHQDGTKPYFVDSHTAGGIASIHEHANNDRTVGMGELNMVMNGVEFRTRHNDYRLRMPSRLKSQYNHLVDIPFPPVPPAVLAKHTVAEQITEMREWFKAFHNQDYSVRDYRKYFKPVLTYMEGGWTTNTKTLNEPFFSDRHHIDADNWFDLQDKVRFTSYAGSKSVLENFAYLPTTIMNVVNGTPQYAQWNYRIACHPIEFDLPLNSFELMDDLSERMKEKKPMSKFVDSRKARFIIRPKPTNPRSLHNYHDSSFKWGVIDEIMYQIPGKDNYDATLNEGAFGATAYHIHGNWTKLNTARYHRWYKIDDKDAMGVKIVHRGFADSNLFVAQTTQPGIAPMSVKSCENKALDPARPGHKTKVCNDLTERFTYAVPLEVVYITPLYNWNPYNLQHRGRSGTVSARPVAAGGRNGGMTADKAYNGTHSRVHYWTPTDFFSGGEVQKDHADTTKGAVGVLDRHGVVRKVVASGTRIIVPEIPGVGKIRTRYPIMPLHAEGEHTRKELEALKEMVMRMPTYSSLFEEVPTSVAKANALFNMQEHKLLVADTTRDPPGLHNHEIVIHQGDIEHMKHDAGHLLKGVMTDTKNGHAHSIDVKMTGNNTYVIVSCDGLPHCWDGHPEKLTYVD